MHFFYIRSSKILNVYFSTTLFFPSLYNWHQHSCIKQISFAQFVFRSSPLCWKSSQTTWVLWLPCLMDPAKTLRWSTTAVCHHGQWIPQPRWVLLIELHCLNRWPNPCCSPGEHYNSTHVSDRTANYPETSKQWVLNDSTEHITLMAGNCTVKHEELLVTPHFVP